MVFILETILREEFPKRKEGRRLINQQLLCDQTIWPSLDKRNVNIFMSRFWKM